MSKKIFLVRLSLLSRKVQNVFIIQELAVYSVSPDKAKEIDKVFRNKKISKKSRNSRLLVHFFTLTKVYVLATIKNNKDTLSLKWKKMFLILISDILQHRLQPVH